MASTKRKQDRYQTIDGVEYKLCSSCKEFVPMDAKHYSKRAASADGFAYSCKSCERAASRKSYKKKQQKKKAQERYKENREEVIARQKKRYQENKDAILDQQKAWRQTNKGREKVNAASKVRRERIKEQTPQGKDYTEADVLKKAEVFGQHICAICGYPVDIEHRADWHIDHIIPIVQGGADILDNVQLTHRKCNLTRPKDGSDLNK